jgi:Zn-dependent protease
LNQYLKCQQCGREEVLPFQCSFCKKFFCSEHRLPENHNCPEIWKAKTPKEEAPSYKFKVTYQPQRQLRRFRFSTTEIRDLALSALLVSGVGLSFLGFGLVESQLSTVAVLVVVFTGSFLIHEMAHKFIAQRYGLWAEFRLTLIGALLTLISVISPFKIISPGAVMIAGAADKNTVGKTAVSGPLTNLTICAVSFAFTFFASPNSPFFIVVLFSAAFNAFIAVLNLIPFGILDGWKVFQWNRLVWVTALLSSAALLVGIFWLYSDYIQF